MAKKNKKTAASRGETALPKSRGTGLEEYYADPPMKPEEALEEREDIYGPDIPFEDRIQSCIHRFRARRRLQGKSTRFFDEYLFLGGIDTNPSPFSGRDARDLKQMTVAERREATATDMVHGAEGGRFYDGDPERWDVDFAGVASGFFAYCLPNITEMSAIDLDLAISVVENFLRYVLHHDVCPEHSVNVNEALAVCDRAREEWPLIAKIRVALPGQFNFAASKLFSGKDANTEWPEECYMDGETDLRDLDAEVIFHASLAFVDGIVDPERLRMCPTVDHAPQILRLVKTTVEIVAIEQPSDELADQMRSLEIGGKHANIAPMGKATVKQAAIEDGWVRRKDKVLGAKEVTLCLDDGILALVRLGMKMDVVLGELDIAVFFLQAVNHIVPSFYTFLPQELMRHYKVPKDSGKPAPSVNDGVVRADSEEGPAEKDGISDKTAAAQNGAAQDEAA